MLHVGITVNHNKPYAVGGQIMHSSKLTDYKHSIIG